MGFFSFPCTCTFKKCSPLLFYSYLIKMLFINAIKIYFLSTFIKDLAAAGQYFRPTWWSKSACWVRSLLITAQRTTMSRPRWRLLCSTTFASSPLTSASFSCCWSPQSFSQQVLGKIHMWSNVTIFHNWDSQGQSVPKN